MVSMDIQVLLVAAAYPDLAGRTTLWPVENAGGFSGARLWRLSSPRGEYVIRCWPAEHPSHERLAWIHGVLHHAVRHGYPLLSEPLKNIHSGTVLYHAGRLWEAAPWLPGTADYRHAPRRVRLRAALESLALFHLAASGYEADSARQPAPGIRERNVRIRQWLDGRLGQLATVVGQAALHDPADPIHRLARQILECIPTVTQVILDDLTSSLTIRLSLQPCLRDVWHEHVLFDGDRVTGLIDYGAMRRDTVAADIARLLGSLAGDDASSWQTGLDSYESVRPLSAAERSLVAAYDRSAILLAPLNWLDWLFLEQRTFENRMAVAERLAEWTSRLQHLTLRLDEKLHFPQQPQSP